LDGEGRVGGSWNLAAAARSGAPNVSIDVLSGVMGDTGADLGAVACALTIA